jgi:glycosyltransferase involved in cell wall biosynthesis
MNSRSLRIGVIGIRGLPSAYSGLESSCEKLYTLLASRGHEITVYCRSEYLQNHRQHYNGIRLCSAPAIRRRSLETLSHVGASLVHALILAHYDIIHFHAEAPGLFLPLTRVLKAPTVMTVHGLDWQRAKWKGVGAVTLKAAERCLATHANEIIVVSRNLQAYFASRYERATHYIPNGVGELSSVVDKDLSVLPKFGLEPSRYVLYLARLVPEKRVEDLLRAFMAIRSPQRLAIVGEGGFTGDYVTGLKRLAASDPRIVFTGFQQRAAVRSLFSNASIYVLPSELEGLPLSLLECIDVGTPAVVSDIAPHRELLGNTPGYDLFFTPGDVTMLQAKLVLALGRPLHYRKVAAQIRDSVRKYFDWGVIADQTEQLYYKALGEAFPMPREDLCVY